jgi:hypothetical protein
MAKTRAAARLLVSDQQRAELQMIAASPSLSDRGVRQAKGLLDASVGVGNEEIGCRRAVSANTVLAWRASLARTGVAGVGKVAPMPSPGPFPTQPAHDPWPRRDDDP